MAVETVLVGRSGIEVRIGPGRPTAIVGERINPTGRRAFAAEILAGDLSRVASVAERQAQEGAVVIDVNVGVAGADEVALLPRAVAIAQEAVDLPISIDTTNVSALAAALRVVRGRPLINSLNASDDSLDAVLPLAAAHGAAVVALCMADDIPSQAAERFALAQKIVARAKDAGLVEADILFDPLAMTVAAEPQAAQVCLETARLIRERLGCNMTLGASNISFGMPDRPVVNQAFLAMMLSAGVNAPIADPRTARPTVLAVDLLLGNDEYARRYVRAFRERLKGGR